jgi:hypothetical protein
MPFLGQGGASGPDAAALPSGLALESMCSKVCVLISFFPDLIRSL